MSKARVTVSTASSELKRGSGLFDSTMIVAGSMIGSGIFIVSAEMAHEVGAPDGFSACALHGRKPSARIRLSVTQLFRRYTIVIVLFIYRPVTVQRVEDRQQTGAAPDLKCDSTCDLDSGIGEMRP